MIKNEGEQTNDGQERRILAEGRSRFILRRGFLDWMKQNDGRSENVRLLTSEQIRQLALAAKKNLDRVPLTDYEKTCKSEVLRGLSNSLSDMSQLARLGLMDPESPWIPTTVKRPEKNLVYRESALRNAFNIQDLSVFVGSLSDMFGDEYAIPLADAIRSGLQKREEREQQKPKRIRVACDVDVPVIRRKRA